jgi:hypothetical protein
MKSAIPAEDVMALFGVMAETIAGWAEAALPKGQVTAGIRISAYRTRALVAQFRGQIHAFYDEYKKLEEEYGETKLSIEYLSRYYGITRDLNKALSEANRTARHLLDSTPDLSPQDTETLERVAALNLQGLLDIFNQAHFVGV